jgi:DNA-binding NtrC family response regulator
MSLPDMTGEELLLKLNRIAPEMNFIITTGDANYEPGPEVSGIERKKIRIIPKPASGSKIADTIMKQIKENRDDREA